MTPEKIQKRGAECPLCGASSLRRFQACAHDAQPRGPQAITVNECTVCEWAWQFPIARDAHQSRDAFDEAYASAKEGSYFDASRRSAVADFQSDFLLRELSPRSLLDIGCGDGTFAIAMARSGCEVVGVDPALPPVVESGEKSLPATLIRGDLTAVEASRVFDVVTLWDVIEHVPDPLALLTSTFERVRPGGSLVLETGNYQSAGRIEAGDRWWCYQLDHRWYFSPMQLQELLATTGFHSVRVVDRVLRPWWRGELRARPPGMFSTLRQALRSPSASRAVLERHRQLRRASIRWSDWSGLDITTLVATRPA